METAPGQTTQPVNLSKRGGTPTIIAPPTGTMKNIELPQTSKTKSAPIHEPCQRFIFRLLEAIFTYLFYEL
jgi:hypothetical protein